MNDGPGWPIAAEKGLTENPGGMQGWTEKPGASAPGFILADEPDRAGDSVKGHQRRRSDWGILQRFAINRTYGRLALREKLSLPFSPFRSIAKTNRADGFKNCFFRIVTKLTPKNNSSRQHNLLAPPDPAGPSNLSP
jgi:hypothetical protein